MTFALVARCDATGMFGAAVASSSPAVAARCPHVAAGVGAFSSQNITDPTLGEAGLALMRDGASAADAIAALRRDHADIEYRQLIAVGGAGAGAVFSGRHVLGVSARASAEGVAAAGNLLANAGVIDAMLDGYLRGGGHFGERLLAALDAALAAGGEAGPIHSAGMKIARDLSWPYVDLRCDWSEQQPLARLRRAWEVYQPQADDYVQRALAPAESPSYNVPGDE